MTLTLKTLQDKLAALSKERTLLQLEDLSVSSQEDLSACDTAILESEIITGVQFTGQGSSSPLQLRPKALNTLLKTLKEKISQKNTLRHFLKTPTDISTFQVANTVFEALQNNPLLRPLYDVEARQKKLKEIFFRIIKQCPTDITNPKFNPYSWVQLRQKYFTVDNYFEKAKKGAAAEILDCSYKGPQTIQTLFQKKEPLEQVIFRFEDLSLFDDETHYAALLNLLHACPFEMYLVGPTDSHFKTWKAENGALCFWTPPQHTTLLQSMPDGMSEYHVHPSLEAPCTPLVLRKNQTAHYHFKSTMASSTFVFSISQKCPQENAFVLTPFLQRGHTQLGSDALLEKLQTTLETFLSQRNTQYALDLSKLSFQEGFRIDAEKVQAFLAWLSTKTLAKLTLPASLIQATGYLPVYGKPKWTKLFIKEDSPENRLEWEGWVQNTAKQNPFLQSFRVIKNDLTEERLPEDHLIQTHLNQNKCFANREATIEGWGNWQAPLKKLCTSIDSLSDREHIPELNFSSTFSENVTTLKKLASRLQSIIDVFGEVDDDTPIMNAVHSVQTAYGQYAAHLDRLKETLEKALEKSVIFEPFDIHAHLKTWFDMALDCALETEENNLAALQAVTENAPESFFPALYPLIADCFEDSAWVSCLPTTGLWYPKSKKNSFYLGFQRTPENQLSVKLFYNRGMEEISEDMHSIEASDIQYALQSNAIKQVTFSDSENPDRLTVQPPHKFSNALEKLYDENAPQRTTPLHYPIGKNPEDTFDELSMLSIEGEPSQFVGTFLQNAVLNTCFQNSQRLTREVEQLRLPMLLDACPNLKTEEDRKKLHVLYVRTALHCLPGNTSVVKHANKSLPSAQEVELQVSATPDSIPDLLQKIRSEFLELDARALSEDDHTKTLDYLLTTHLTHYQHASLKEQALFAKLVLRQVFDMAGHAHRITTVDPLQALSHKLFGKALQGPECENKSWKLFSSTAWSKYRTRDVKEVDSLDDILDALTDFLRTPVAKTKCAMPQGHTYMRESCCFWKKKEPASAYQNSFYTLLSNCHSKLLETFKPTLVDDKRYNTDRRWYSFT